MIDQKLFEAIAAGRNGMRSADDIAHGMGYRPARDGRLAVTQKLRKAERDGMVGRIAPRDRWSCAVWSLTAAGREVLKSSSDCPNGVDGEEMSDSAPPSFR